MKLALILPNNVWFCPYVTIYTQILDAKKIQYDIISWNRDGKEDMPLQYNKKLHTRNKIILLRAYVQYANHIKKILKRTSYDKLIVFTAPLGIFLASYLKRAHKNKYIFDYRDVSIEQFFIFKHQFIKLLKNSYATMLSSFGYKQVLPKGYNYILSHNFNVEHVKNALQQPTQQNIEYDDINILTIGGIRNYESNINIVKALANKKSFKLSFVGKGEVGKQIYHYALKNQINNVYVTGYYPKEEEENFVKASTFINIVFPKVTSHSTILSNRFYLALVHKKPMIVTSNSFQSNYVERYNLGLSVDNCEHLDETIIHFLKRLNYVEFQKQCNYLLRIFLKDYYLFEQKVNQFIED
jgi:hypothetical protein